MAEGQGIKLAALAFVGILFLEVGINGSLGSILGAFIDPANMQNTGDNGTNGTGTSGSNGSTTGGTYPKNATTTIIASVFGSYAPQAVKIAQAESSLNPNATNNIMVGRSYATGLFQILYPETWQTTSQATGNPYDALTNTKAAYEIFKRDGYSWREWATAKGLGLS